MQCKALKRYLHILNYFNMERQAIALQKQHSEKCKITVRYLESEGLFVTISPPVKSHRVAQKRGEILGAFSSKNVIFIDKASNELRSREHAFFQGEHALFSGLTISGIVFIDPCSSFKMVGDNNTFNQRP